MKGVSICLAGRTADGMLAFGGPCQTAGAGTELQVDKGGVDEGKERPTATRHDVPDTTLNTFRLSPFQTIICLSTFPGGGLVPKRSSQRGLLFLYSLQARA